MIKELGIIRKGFQMYQLFRKCSSLLLPLLLFLSVMTIQVYAADYSVANGNVLISGNASQSGDTITATAQANKKSTATNTLTLKNTTGKKAQIHFSWTAYASNDTGASCSIASSTTSMPEKGNYIFGNFSGKMYSGEYTGVLEDGGTIDIILNATGGTYIGNTVTLTLTGFTYTVVSDNYKVTIGMHGTGIVTINGETVSSNDTYEVPPTGADLVATPSSGYRFLGWRNSDSGELLSTNTSYKVTPTVDMNVQAVFVNSSSDTAWFLVDNFYLVDHLTTAGNLGAKIVLMNNGTLIGSHTIESGDTLLIPCDDAHTVYTTKPGDDGADTYKETSKFRELTMAEGANITVNGAISIGGKIGTNMTGEVVSTTYYFTNGAPSGPLGYIAMNSGSGITVNSGGDLYAWGFITGSGDVTIKNGGMIYEDLQIRDYRGGNCTTSMLQSKDTYEVFPFSQYYIQNVECPLTLEAGAIQNVCTAVSYSYLIDSTISKENAVFLGADSGLIRLSYGSLTRTYDGSTDRTVYELNGNVEFANLSVSITVSVGSGITINSKDFFMPLNSNMTMIANSGSQVALNQDLALLPGAILNIKNGATMTMGSGNRMIVYDSVQWGGYTGATNNSKLVTVYYAPGRTGTRSESSLVDAQIIVDGTLDATSGFLYTTSSGANITSNGGGVVKIAKGSDTVTYQITQSGNKVGTWNEIPVTPAWLFNSDGSYTITADSTETPNTYNYVEGRWICKTHTGVTTDHTCDVCGYVTECIDSDHDLKCDICGLDYLFDIYATSISVTDSLNMYFYIKADDLVDGIVTDKTVGQGYYAVINRAYTGNDTEKKKEIKISSEDWSVEPHGDVQCVRFCYDNISAKEMTDAISVVIYNSNDVQVSQSYTETVKDYAIRTLNCYEGESNASMRKALVDMLNYGAACQDYFNYNNEPEKLANYQLDSKFAGESTQQDPVCTSYLEDTVNMVAASISARNRLMYTFYFKNISSDMRAIVTDETGNQLLEITGMATDSTPGFIQYGNWLGVDVTGLSMVDGRRMLTCKVYNGNTLVASGTDSVEGYVKRAKDAGLNQPVFGMLMRFVDSAIAYSNS